MNNNVYKPITELLAWLVEAFNISDEQLEKLLNSVGCEHSDFINDTEKMRDFF